MYGKERAAGEKFVYVDWAGVEHELVVEENRSDVGCYGCFFCWTKKNTVDERCVAEGNDWKQIGPCAGRADESEVVYFALASDVGRGIPGPEPIEDEDEDESQWDWTE